MKEDLLYYIWNLKRFDHDGLETTTGLPIRVLDRGHRNPDAGPDFLNARLQIADKIWVGHVEMHVKASDWYRHEHDMDRAYDSVILHVVYEDDRPVKLSSGEDLACLEMAARIPQQTIASYDHLIAEQRWIPCEANQRDVTPIALRAMYERLLVERLMRKTDQIGETLAATENDWEETLYRYLARNFGFKVNADAFEALAHRLPRRLLLKHRDSLKQLEALLFGQAGLLPEKPRDEYTLDLAQEYTFLANKYGLVPLQAQVWRFLRMRPANFPTIRLAQFAVLLYRTEHLFSKMLSAKNVGEIQQMFRSEVSWYWRTHYMFDEPSTKRSKKLGRASIQLLIINTVAPMLFHYGQVHQDEGLQDRAMELLASTPPESNGIIRKYKQLDFPAESAFDTQALLQLKSHYCDTKQCLQCAVGHAIMSDSKAAP